MTDINSEGDKPLKAPAMWSHCLRVYEAMERQSVRKVIFEEERVVWEGFLTKLFKELGLSVPLYTEVRQELMRMGCMSQLRRGGGPTPSIWVLFGPPTLEEYNKVPPESINTKGGAKKRSAMDVLQAQINTINLRLGVVEKAVFNREIEAS